MFRFGRNARARKLIDRADRARDKRNWSAAVRFYRKALGREPINPPIWVQYGHALKESGRLMDAEQAYRIAIFGDPGSADTQLQLGHVLKLQRKTPEAEAAYLVSSTLDPASPEPMHELREFGWPDAAVTELKRITEIELEANPIQAGSTRGLGGEEASLGAVQYEADMKGLAAIVSEAERWADWSDAAAAHMQAEITAVRRTLSRTLRRSALMLARAAE
jgi:tetratricopeptide (TPR) repeat protein